MSGKDDNAHGSWEKQAVAQVVDLCLPCSPYVPMLMDSVKLYGGGPGAPLARFMDGDAEQLGCNATLGSTFWQSITYTNLGDKMCKWPLTRVALALCNLQTDRKEDCIAKLLTSGDVKRLTSKAGLSESKQLEGMLKEAMDILEAVVNANAHGKVRDQLMKPMGQLFVRGTLECAGKPMTSGRGKAIPHVEMKQMFMEDMSEAAGTSIKYKDWHANESDAQVGPEHDHETPAEAHAFASMTDHSNPEWIAKQRKFEVGQLVQQRNVGGKILIITSIDTNGVKLQMVGSYSAEVFEAVVKLQELFGGFLVTKSEPPIKLEVSQMAIKLAQRTVKKAMIWQALADAYAKAVHKPASSNICFWKRPNEVRTNSKSINANALCLVPFVPLANINSTVVKPFTQGYNVVSFGKHYDSDGPGVEFYAFSPSPNSKAQHDESWMIAYW